MIKETDLAWLAGIIDGEGCISTQIGTGFSLSLRINTISHSMADKITSIYDQLNVKYGRNVLNQKDAKRPLIYTNVGNAEGIKKVLIACMPYMTTKLPEAKLLVEYIDGPRDNKVYVDQTLRQLKREVHLV